MDDFFWVFIIIFFIVAPILEKALKGRRGQQQPQRPPGRPQQTQRRPRLPDGRTTTVRQPPTARGPGEDATDLLPSDLWEILTGRQREPEQQPEPVARPAPPLRAEPVARFPARQPAAPRRPPGDEEGSVDDLLSRRERETALRRRIDPAMPVVVSLETEPLAESKRHGAFHQKLEQLSTPARVSKPASPVFKLDPGDRPALQRAILINEVLGRPRGLDD